MPVPYNCTKMCLASVNTDCFVLLSRQVCLYHVIHVFLRKGILGDVVVVFQSAAARTTTLCIRRPTSSRSSTARCDRPSSMEGRSVRQSLACTSPRPSGTPFAKASSKHTKTSLLAHPRTQPTSCLLLSTIKYQFVENGSTKLKCGILKLMLLFFL